MDIKKSVDRIKALSKDRGFKMKHLCTKLGVRENYFNDCKNKNLTIERISEPFIVWGTVFVQTRRHSLP